VSVLRETKSDLYSCYPPSHPQYPPRSHFRLCLLLAYRFFFSSISSQCPVWFVVVACSSAVWSSLLAAAVQSALDDSIQRPAVVYTVDHLLASDDTAYAAMPLARRTLGVTVVDNDAAGVLITPTTLSLLEGNSSMPASKAAYRVCLTSEPLANVTIDVVMSVIGLGQATLSRTMIVLSPVTWRSGEVVEVAAVDDAVIEPLQVGFVLRRHG
jgi:hypothetical protein